MLNVPEEVKALFKRDDVYKNFRVHFPNGETADFDNSSIVSESVKFTESLCSQQSFRFGLTEASQISFTAVNIPNIRGVTIECALDIDVSSLGMTWINANLSPDGFDFLSLACYLNDSEDGGFYRIPYGRFIVDTCPRNHESMWKREVTAYTERIEDSFSNPFQIASMNAFYPGANTYTQNVKPLVMSALYYQNPDALLSKGYTKESITISSIEQSVIIPLTLKTTGGASKTINFSIYFSSTKMWDAGSYQYDGTSLYGVTKTGTEEYPDVLQGAIEALESIGINASASGFDSLRSIVEFALPTRGHFVREKFTVNSQIEYADIEIPQNSTLMYPSTKEAESMSLCEMHRVEISNETDLEYIYSVYFPSVLFDKYVDSNSSGVVEQFMLSFDSTLETKRKYGSHVVECYSFANAFSVPEIVRGYLELQCKFGSPARVGGMEITLLDNSNPIELLPDNYSELWYDETTISPIGFVELNFKDETGNDQEITVQIGSGSSIYDLRDNEVLANMAFTISKSEAEAGITIQSKLIAFLNSIFTPNIPDLTFVPIELSKKGLPYLEAGDAIEIETEDGQIVPSFILRQTITGIQFLSADVESSNGEAMEMIET